MAPEPQVRLGFPRARRITKTTDIERVLRSGRRIRARLFDVKRLDTPVGYIRLAIVVPKFGFTAVRRNQLKRRIRELSRTVILPRAQSYDLIVRARREAYAATFAELRDDVHAFVAQLA